jgi:hypothetical protein
MRFILCIATVAGVIGTYSSHAKPVERQDRESTGPIARSGDVEIDQIGIERRKVSYADKEADLVYMTLSFWLPVGGEGGDFRREAYSIRLVELQPIEDNTGKLLSTKSRLQAIPALSEEISASQMASRVGKQGPILQMELDAPARGATSLKLVKGKVEVRRRMEGDILKFDDLATRIGKRLDHPKLKDFPITPSMKFEVESTWVTLHVPTEHVRLLNWKLVSRGRELSADGHGKGRRKDGVELWQVYTGDHRKNCSLEIELAAPVEATTMPFEFKNLELP